ncbi:hypothetical protein B9Z55_001772 [Caenorhabditis nigoni]|uniref:Uncharacterized protein n=1 Tax=Caenorhabditis nigoni TaxID=1611254 RepID=A0A2G5VHR9_9PELO|nr:hypothetical protein B9Z55_001772 [Caenorhabditis nigoni]
MARGSSQRGGASGTAAAKKKKLAVKKKEELSSNPFPSRKRPPPKTRSFSSSEMSSRGIRERTKWRKKKRELERKKAEQLAEKKRIQEEAELLKRKLDEQKKVFKKRFEIYEKVLLEADTNQKDVENILNDHRKWRNFIKFKLQSESEDIIQTQKNEKSQLTAASVRICASEGQIYKFDNELTKTKQMREEYIRDLQEVWYIRFWKWLY